MNNSLISKLLRITLGTLLMAFGIFNFAIQNDLAEGGFTGITILLYQLYEISPSTSNLMLNIPMFILGFRLFNRQTFWLTVYGTIMLSVFLGIFEHTGFLIPSFFDDMILASIGLGVLVGSGLGIIFNAGGTTGGVDIIAKLIKLKFNVPMSQTMFIFDACVIALSLVVFLSFEDAIYTLIGLYIASKIIERFQSGFQAGNQVLVISQKHDEIAHMIHEKMNRGATFLHGAGTYNKSEQTIVLTIIKKRELQPLKEAIYKIDPLAFVSVSHVYETLGEGFTFDQDGIPYYE